MNKINLLAIFMFVSFLVLSEVSDAASLIPSLTTGAGYDDNIDFLADNISRDVLFLMKPKLDINLNLSEIDIIAVSYSYTFQQFLMSGNFTDHFGYAAYEHYFTDRISIELAGEGEIFNDSVVSLYNYRRTAVLPSIKYSMGKTMMIHSYGFSDIDFPDRTIQTGGDKQKDKLTEVSMFMLHGISERTTIGGGYSYKKNSSNNDSYDYTSQNISIGVWHHFSKKVGLNFIYQYQLLNFDNWRVDSSLRKDSYTKIYSELSYEIDKSAKFFCQYSYLFNDSNDVNQDFKKNYIFLGLKYTFDKWKI